MLINKRFSLIALFSFLTASPVMSSMICVSQVQARLRESPSTKAALVRVVYENTPLELISKKGRWLQVRDYSGKEFYIFDSLISEERECLVVLGGGRTYRNPNSEAVAHQERNLVHHLEGLQILSKERPDRNLEFIKVLDRFGNEFWISSETRVWPKEL